MGGLDPMYKIVRFYKDSGARDEVARDLTLDEARAWCNDRETSSSTCIRSDNVRRTSLFGEWFDGYVEEGDDE